MAYHILSIQTLCSVFSRSTLLIYYRHESFWERVFHTWIWGSSAIPPCRSSTVLSGWMVNVGGQPFLGLSRDAQLGLSQGSGWAIQEQSRSCCEATPSLF